MSDAPYRGMQLFYVQLVAICLAGIFVILRIYVKTITKMFNAADYTMITAMVGLKTLTTLPSLHSLSLYIFRIPTSPWTVWSGEAPANMLEV